MSAKHNQRTRTEILAKRQQPIPESRLNRDRFGAPARTSYKPQRSIYVPLIGAKEQERAKRCYMETHFPPFGRVVRGCFRTQFPRSAPVMQQMSKATHEAYLEAREQEYESVF